MCNSSCENDKLLPSPMQSGLVTIFNQHIVPYSVNKCVTYTDVISEGEHVHARSSRVNILALSIRQTHTFHLLPYGMGRVGVGGLSPSHKHSCQHPPTHRQSSTCVLTLNFAWLLIWAAGWYSCLLPCSQHPHTGCKENYSLFSPHNKSVGAQRAAAFT